MNPFPSVMLNKLKEVFSSITHNHDGSYSKLGHDHDSTYSKLGHTHTGLTPAAHTHTKSEITDFAHTHTLTELGAAASSHSHTLASLGAASSSHTHSYSDVGAASSSHTHTYSEVGAAASNHSHSGYLTSIPALDWSKKVNLDDKSSTDGSTTGKDYVYTVTSAGMVWCYPGESGDLVVNGVELYTDRSYTQCSFIVGAGDVVQYGRTGYKSFFVPFK